MISNRKVATPLDELCKDMPFEFMTYIDYTRKLTFEGQPDYNFLRDLFRKVSVREGVALDFEFDWLIQMMVSKNSEKRKQFALTISIFISQENDAKMKGLGVLEKSTGKQQQIMVPHQQIIN